MTRRIVVGWDGSSASRSALRWALDHVAGRSDRLTVVHAVLDDLAAQPLSAADFSVRAAVETLLSPDRALRIDVEVHRGTPVAVLLASADALSMIVVGSDRVPAARGERPSVADRLVDGAPCTVVVVPVAPIEPRHGIVVGVDPRGTSRSAMLFAAQEARRTRQGVVAVTAWPQGGAGDADERVDPERMRHLRALEESVESAYAGSPDIEVIRRLVAGAPARRLVEVAEGTSLIVVGAGGRHGRAGPVTEQVARASKTPVAVVR